MDLSCFYREESFQGHTFYCAVISNASIAGPATKIGSILGKHVPGRTSSHVEAIKFADSTVTYFPRNLIKIFPNLKAVAIDNCGLKSIWPEDLKGLENLEILKIRRNNLRSLPSDLFTGSKKLRIVSFAGNKLEFVSSELIEPILGQLQFFNLEGNIKIDKKFDSRYDQSLAALMDTIDKNCSLPEQEISQEFLKQSEWNIAKLWLLL
jgi:hypothetical protein